MFFQRFFVSWNISRYYYGQRNSDAISVSDTVSGEGRRLAPLADYGQRDTDAISVGDTGSKERRRLVRRILRRVVRDCCCFLQDYCRFGM